MSFCFRFYFYLFIRSECVKKLFILLVFCLASGLIAHENDELYFTRDNLHNYETVILIVDPQSGRIVDYSRGAYDFYGYPQLRGMNINHINTLSPAEVAVEMKLAKTEKRNFFEFKHLLADGSVRDVHVNSYPIQLRNRTVLMSRVRDVTDECARERLAAIAIFSVIVFLVLVVIFILTLLLLIRNEKRLVLRENAAKTAALAGLKESEAEIRRQLEDKELLLRESHHRIKNNIFSIETLLVMQSKSVSSPEALSVLQDAISRVQGMRVLYQKLLGSGNYREDSLKRYIEELVESFNTVYPPEERCEISLQVADITLPANKLFPLGIVINELLTNILKHAFSSAGHGHVAVDLTVEENGVLLRITDNGRGLPDGFDLGKTNSFGLMIVKMLAKQLDGVFTIENSPSGGTRSTLVFPLAVS